MARSKIVISFDNWLRDKNFTHIKTDVKLDTSYDSYKSFYKTISKDINLKYDYEYKCLNCGIIHHISLPLSAKIPKFCSPQCVARYYGKLRKENEFLEWLRNHLQLIDIYRDLPFKNPPEWLIEKQKADKRAFMYINKRNWTDEEDKLLIDLINKGYGYRDIGIKLKRTYGALKRRLKDLGLNIRPKRVPTKHIWTDEEISFIRDLYKKGYKACVIQEFLPPHSEAAINGIIEHNNYFGEVIRFRNIKGK